MPTTYTKSLSSDFGGSLKSEQFHEEIVASSIVPALNAVNTTGDVVDIVFASALSGAEQTTLDTLITNHTPDTTPELNNKRIVSVRNRGSTDATYKVYGKFTFPGSTNASVKTISRMQAGATDYSIKIYDFTNDQTITENTYTNVPAAINNVVCSNVPASEAIWEVQVKVSSPGSDKKMHINSVSVNFA